MSRVNSAASALKRLLSRSEEGGSPPTNESSLPKRTGSNSSLNKKSAMTGSMKITDQVIMEVDEQQATITTAKNDTTRPTVMSVFNEIPPASAPIPIPNSSGNNSRSPGHSDFNRAFSTGLPVDHSSVLPSGGVDSLLSQSMPIGGRTTPRYEAQDSHDSKTSQQQLQDEGGELDFNVPVDEFEMLKAKREQERKDKQKDQIANAMSPQPPLMPTSQPTLNTDILLENLNTVAAEQARSVSPSASEKRNSGDIPADTQL